MKIRIIIPYRLYKFSMIEYKDLFDENTYSFDRIECKGYFSIDNLEKYNNRSFKEMQRISNLSNLYLSRIEYDDSFNYYLRFNITCTCDNTCEIKNDEIPSTEMRRIRKEILISSIVEEIHKYLLLLVLKTNNSISILKGFSISGETLIAETKQILSGLYLEEYNEKLVYKMDMLKSWEFINKKTMFINGLSKTNVARAISILSLILFEDNSEVSNMALVLTAIEALYARGNTGISSQLAEKIGLFLGTSLVNSKEINQLYNTRSRYIHGDIDIYMSFCTHDDDIKREMEVYDAYNYGMAILFETIKKVINENMDELNFIIVSK
jgi:hypothetical protein